MRRITLGILSASAAFCTLTAVQPAALADAPVAHAAQARLDLQPIYFDSFTVSYDPWGEVSFYGGVRSDSEIYSALPLTIEYSPDGETGWTVKKNVTAEGGGNVFSAKFFYGRSGYWRARFAGDATYQAATSPVRKAWRWRTEIHSFKVSPKKVRKNHYVTASGSLIRWTTNTKHSGYSGRKVRIVFRFKGKKTWYHLAWAKTNSKGKFAKKVHAYGTGYYAAVFEGGKDTFASESSNTAYVKTTGLAGGSAIAQTSPGVVVDRTPALSGPFVTGGPVAARRD